MPFWLRISLWVLALGVPAEAQVSLGAGAIEGNVRDASGAAVPNAAVEAKNIATGVTRATKTDPTGRYTFLSLPVGEYEVKAEATGLRTTVRSGVVLQIGR